LENSEDFEPGTICECVYNDGKYYPCSVDKIIDNNYQIKYRKWNTVELVSLAYLRKLENPESGNQAKKVLNGG